LARTTSVACSAGTRNAQPLGTRSSSPAAAGPTSASSRRTSN